MHKNIYIGENVLDRMMKKGLIFLVILGMFVFSSGFVLGDTGLMIEGYVYDVVTGERISNPVVRINYGGAFVTARTKVNPAPDNQNPNAYDGGHYDWFYGFVNVGDSLTLEAYDNDKRNCRGTKKVSISGSWMIEPIPICCYPTKPSGLNPSGPMHIVEPTEIEFSWDSGIKGNNAYPDIWDVFVRPTPRVDSATSPIIRIITGGLPGWEIQTCNGDKSKGEFCCDNGAVGGGYSNDACGVPKNLEGEYKGGSVITTWEPGEPDPDGDPIHYNWKAWSYDDSGVVPEDASWAGEEEIPDLGEKKFSAIAEAHLSTLWQVQCCDDYGGCSRWVQAIVPGCNKVSGDCPVKRRIRDLRNTCELPGVDEMPRPFETLWGWIWLILRILAVAYIIFYENDKRVKRKRAKKKIKVKRHGPGR